eukprot:GFUD01002006.1.p1 GENE.GFUD01002006.1~~GFUD01002006.1.p1  ORF type:complete len:836 (-),score=280.54 GFUD01002006.1:475-2982(-)
MSSVRTRAVSRPVPVSGQRIPPPPPFAPPSLPDTDSLLSTYSRSRSGNSSRSVSPGVAGSTEQESDLGRSQEELSTYIEIKSETIEEKCKLLSDDYDEKDTILLRHTKTPEMNIEPPTPPTEMKFKFNEDITVKSNKTNSHTKNSNPAQGILNKSENMFDKITGIPFHDKEAEQTQEYSEHSQHNCDQVTEKAQENVLMGEVEKETLYDRFPLQEEKQVKHKLKRRVSKKVRSGKIQNYDELNEDKQKTREKEKEKNFYDEQLINDVTYIEGKEENTDEQQIDVQQIDEQQVGKDGKSRIVRSRSNSRMRTSLISKDCDEPLHPQKYVATETKSQKANVDISEMKIDSYALEGLSVTESDAMVELTTSEGKVRMETNIQVERKDNTESDILAKNEENVEHDNYNIIDPDDIVHEILGSCNDVNKILNRIMDNKSESDDEESDLVEINNILEVDNDKTEDIDILQESFACVENIADLTVEEVKEYLQMEEKVNESLKQELEITKQRKKSLEYLEKDKTVDNLFADKSEINKNQEANCISQFTDDKSLNSKIKIVLQDSEKQKTGIRSDIHVAGTQQPNEKPKLANKKKTNFSSKKDQQMAKIKDFLKDPNSTENEEVKLDVRLRQSDTEKEESSKEVTKILDCLCLASYTVLTECDTSKDGVTSVIEISTSHKPLARTDVLHIKISEDNVALEDNFEQIADKVENSRKDGGKVLIVCENSSGLAATLCVPYLVKYEGMSTRSAAKIVEERRQHAKLHAGTLLRMEEWERKMRGRKLSGGVSSLMASWLPMLFVILLGYMVFKMVFERMDREHTEEKRTTTDMYIRLYEYFDVRKWP